MFIVTRKSKAQHELANIRETIKKTDKPTEHFKLGTAAREQRERLAREENR